MRETVKHTLAQGDFIVDAGVPENMMDLERSR
jgi:hypothetical protein